MLIAVYIQSFSLWGVKTNGYNAIRKIMIAYSGKA